MTVRTDNRTHTATDTRARAQTTAPDAGIRSVTVAADEPGIEPFPIPSSSSMPSTHRLAGDERARLTRDIDAATSKRFPSDAEKAVLLGDLARLPAADCRDVLDDQTRLERILGVVDGDDRTLLLDLLTKKGVVAAQPASPTASTSPHAPTPPRAPALLRDDPAAAPALRRAILDENLARVAAYREQYASYRTSWRDAIADADDVAALRDLGPLAPSALPATLPGAPLDAEAQRRFLDARGRSDADVDATRAVADRFRALTGRAIAGTSFTAELEASVVLGDPHAAHAELGGKLEATLANDGTLHPHAAGAAKAGLEYAVATREHGQTGVDVAVHGNGVAVTEKQVALKGHVGVVVGQATFAGDRMDFSLGLEAERTLADGVDLKLGVAAKAGLQGVNGFDAAGFTSTSDIGFFDTPPELVRGRTWSSLPAVIRADYERQGWTSGEWAKKAAFARFTRRAG
jgi:hypothetical protein